MADWRLHIDEFLKGQGFEKKAPEFNETDIASIQEFIDNIGKPAFENITDRLNAYKDVRAEVLSSATSLPTVELYELTVYNKNQPKLTYRFRFSKDMSNHIMLGGEYSTPNIYGENTRFHNSSLFRILSGTTEEEIAADFLDILQAKF